MTFRYRSAPYMWARSLVPAHQALALSAAASEMSVSFRQAGCPHGARPAGNFGEQKQGRKHQSEAVQGRYLICCFLYILTARRHVEWPLLGAEGFFFLADISFSGHCPPGNKVVSDKAGQENHSAIDTIQHSRQKVLLWFTLAFSALNPGFYSQISTSFCLSSFLKI